MIEAQWLHPRPELMSMCMCLCSLGGAGDAIILAKRMELSRAGKDTCADMDEECAVEEWI